MAYRKPARRMSGAEIRISKGETGACIGSVKRERARTRGRRRRRSEGGFGERASHDGDSVGRAQDRHDGETCRGQGQETLGHER